MIAKQLATPFATIAEATAYGRAHALRGITTQVVSVRDADEWVILADVQVGDSHFTAHAAAGTIEAAENRSIARALSLALGVTIGNAPEATK